MIYTAHEVVNILRSAESSALRELRQAEIPALVWLEVLDTAPDLVEHVLGAKRLPPEVLHRLATHADWRVRSHVLLKARCTPEIVDQLSRDADLGVKAAAAGDGRLPEVRRRELLADADFTVRLRAAQASPDWGPELAARMFVEDVDRIRRFLVAHPELSVDDSENVASWLDEFMLPVALECLIDALREAGSHLTITEWSQLEALVDTWGSGRSELDQLRRAAS